MPLFRMVTLSVRSLNNKKENLHGNSYNKFFRISRVRNQKDIFLLLYSQFTITIFKQLTYIYFLHFDYLYNFISTINGLHILNKSRCIYNKKLNEAKHCWK